jgi:hypothetical protein
MLVLERFSQKRNSRAAYYLKGIAKVLFPRYFLKINYGKYQTAIKQYGEEKLLKRLNYYHKINQNFQLGESAKCIENIKLKNSGSMYFLDLMEYARFFPKTNKLSTIFLDVRDVPASPTLVKSRPVHKGNNDNSILYKFCKVRNYNFVDDKLKFREKKNKLVWRGSTYQAHRVKFMQQFFNKHEKIDVGQYNKRGNANPQWQVPFMSIPQQLENKFILSIEGNDTSTNTKWIMASNSLCFMTKPKYETWFMEDLLKPNYHYVLVKDDYSDLEELVQYYIDHPEKAEEITRNANEHVDQFRDPKIEDWLSLKVLEQYFKLSGQADIK